MNRRMVIVKHFCHSGHFLFLVPPMPSYENIYAGELVMCDTKRGEQFGTALCDSFTADDEMMCQYFNTNPKAMRYVIARFNREDLDVPKEEEEHDAEDGQPDGGRTV